MMKLRPTIYETKIDRLMKDIRHDFERMQELWDFHRRGDGNYSLISAAKWATQEPRSIWLKVTNLNNWTSKTSMPNIHEYVSTKVMITTMQ